MYLRKHFIDPITELNQQKEQERQLVLDSKIKPHKNHILFEFNTKTKELNRAEFLKSSKEITWFEALSGKHKRKREVIKKENCIYISCLNEENAKKILKTKYNIQP